MNKNVPLKYYQKKANFDEVNDPHLHFTVTCLKSSLDPVIDVSFANCLHDPSLPRDVSFFKGTLSDFRYILNNLNETVEDIEAVHKMCNNHDWNV